MFKDFGKRLRQEVKRHVDQRLKKSEAISGQKVGLAALTLLCLAHLPVVQGNRRQGRVTQAPALRCLGWRLARRLDGMDGIVFS